MEINKKAWIICVVVVLLVFVLSWGGGYPTESKNMHTACDWCEEEGTKLYEDCFSCGCSAACDVCVRCYQEHFNLTVDEFPHYCPNNDDWGSPTRLEWWFHGEVKGFKNAKNWFTTNKMEINRYYS